MVFWISVFVIFVISFLWALSNLSSEISKPRHFKKVHQNKKKNAEKQKLEKEKVLFEK
jgi:hypothetical protein